MHISNIPLLHLLAQDYNQLINTAGSNFTPPNQNNNSDSDNCSDGTDDSDEVFFQMEEIEMVMVALIQEGYKNERRRLNVLL